MSCVLPKPERSKNSAQEHTMDLPEKLGQITTFEFYSFSEDLVKKSWH
jgi:hypothetical protein